MLTNSKYNFKYSNAIETGLSDHHLMVYTMLKGTYEKLPPKEITYRCYKNFSTEKFNNELAYTLEMSKPCTYFHFQNIFEGVLQLYAPIKKKIIRGNNKPHVTKKLRKEIMKRSNLKILLIKRMILKTLKLQTTTKFS